MHDIDPHILMISRITDDFQRMAFAGCEAISEVGFDRGTADGSIDVGDAIGNTMGKSMVDLLKKQAE